MSQRVTVLEQEIERLTEGAELENVSLFLHTCHVINIYLFRFERFCFVYVSFILPPSLQLKREKQHLESELERAERESATYVTEVREVTNEFCSVVYWHRCDNHPAGGHFSLNCPLGKLDGLYLDKL